MSENRNPKLEFAKNQKYKITLKDGFSGESFDQKKNDGSMRPWYAYNVIYNDTVHTCFVNKQLWDELSRYAEGSILEIIDNDNSENWWQTDWDVKAVGDTNPLHKQMAKSKNETDIKIEVFAAMKIAANWGDSVDHLKANTYAVRKIHQEMVQEIINEEELFND
tara:strand:+ start:555 stop:1046 length:492 start_codon:yes stop_codon:yes gene_type:complete